MLKVDKGSTQLWEIRNDSSMTHFIHLHEELWRTVLRDGKRPPPWERGLEDTCLMAQFAVVDPRTGMLPKGYVYRPHGGPAARA